MTASCKPEGMTKFSSGSMTTGTSSSVTAAVPVVSGIGMVSAAGRTGSKRLSSPPRPPPSKGKRGSS